MNSSKTMPAFKMSEPVLNDIVSNNLNMKLNSQSKKTIFSITKLKLFKINCLKLKSRRTV